MVPLLLPIMFQNEQDRLKILNNLENHRDKMYTLWYSRNGISIEKRNGWLAKNIELEYNPLNSADLVLAEITGDELEYMIRTPEMCVLMVIPDYPNGDEDITHAIPFFSCRNEITIH